MEPKAKTTLIVTPRERFGLAVRSLRSIVADTDSPFELVYVDGNAPRAVAAEIAEICAEHGFTLLRRDHFLSPNQARNIGLRAARTANVVFIDNDVVVSPGWLRALEECAEDTGAEVVAPLTCQREPLHSEVHQAGGQIAADLRAFLAGPPDTRRIVDRHLLQGRPVTAVPPARTEVQACEFHCVLARRDVFERVGELDERLLATKEHLDFSLSVWAAGGRVLLEPRSVVTYLFPAGGNALTVADWPFFTLRWSPEWVRSSLEHFRRKWAIEGDPYFTQRDSLLHWRYREGISRPALKRVPLLGRPGRVNRAAVGLANRALDAWGSAMAARHRRRYPSAAAPGRPTAGSERRDPAPVR